MGTNALLVALDHSTYSEMEGLSEEHRPRGTAFEPFQCSLEKSWLQLHVVLTGSDGRSDHPLAILNGLGLEFPMDVYGSAISVDEMQAFNSALEGEDDLGLKARLNTQWMDKWGDKSPHDPNNLDVAWDHATHFLSSLREFAARCSKQQCGALVMIF